LAWADKVDDLTVARLVESLAHKAPGSKVLEIGSENTASILEEPFQINYTVVEASDEAVEATKAKFTDAKGFKVEKLDISAPLADEDVSGTYDLVIATGKVGATELENIRKLVSAGGRLVVKEVPAGFENVEIFVEKDGKVAFAKDAAADEALASKEVTLVYRNEPASIVSTVEEKLTKAGFVTKRSRLDSLEAKDGESVIIVGDLEGSPLLVTINEKEFEGVKHLTSTASSILWVTAGGILTGKKPEYAMTNGLARSVTSEQASLALTTLDFDLETTSVSQLASIVAKTAARQSKKNDIHETGYVVSNGLVYVSRLVAKRGASINTVKSTPVPTPFTEGQYLVAAAQQGKITWTADKREHDPLNAGEIEVKLSYGGLNKEDTVVINGNDYPTTFSYEISGTITKVGCGVTDLKVGDVVVGFAFDKFATFQRTSADLVLKVEKDEDVTKLASLPWSFAQAIYGLETLARVEPGETVLILSNTGAVGAATLKVAQALSAKPFIVTDSEADASALVSKFGIAREQVVIPTISSLARDYKALTNGRGFDVILSGGYTDPVLARESWRYTAPLGRSVDFGRKNDLKHALLDTIPLHQSASYLSYDILDLYAHKPQILAYLLKSAVTLFRKDPSVLVEDAEVYNVADLEPAVSSFSDSVLSSKKVIAYTASEKTLEVVPTAPTLRFSPDATYFLVGCLGGLGRSLTSWMTENGARRFAFLGRSGTDQEQARILVEDLQNVVFTARLSVVMLPARRMLSALLPAFPRSIPFVVLFKLLWP
jgi:NADPH:quinone reductase-like Zn-dependent oxidoreductase